MTRAAKARRKSKFRLDAFLEYIYIGLERELVANLQIVIVGTVNIRFRYIYSIRYIRRGTI